MNGRHPAGDGNDAAADRSAVRRARTIAGALVAGVLLLTAVSALLRPSAALGVLVVPAAALGAISPAIGYRLYLLLRERIPAEAPTWERRAVYVRAVVLSLAVTEAAALFGALVFGLTSDPIALLGPLMHVLLAGAIWPSLERLEGFLTAQPTE